MIRFAGTMDRRDHQPRLLNTIPVFVCTDCSLGVSNTAFDNQAKVSVRTEHAEHAEHAYAYA